MTKKPLLVAVIVIASIGMIPQAVGASEDTWADECEEASIISSTGQYNGSIDSPDDEDVFKLELEQGEYVTVSGLVPQEAISFRLDWEDGITVSPKNWSIGSALTFEPGVRDSVEIWAEERGVVCYRVFEDDGRDADLPYEWQLSLARNDPEPAGFEVTELRDRVSQLESLLEQKNQTIAQLEQESGEVTINVEVTPAGDQQNFVAGGDARINANSENADLNQFSVEYAGNTYSTDSSGTATVPLSGTGEQQLTLRYGDTTQTTSINVQAQSGGQDDTSNQGETMVDTDGDGVPDSEDYAPRDPEVQDESDLQQNQEDGGSGASGAGFGIIVAVIAILTGTHLVRQD